MLVSAVMKDRDSNYHEYRNKLIDEVIKNSDRSGVDKTSRGGLRFNDVPLFGKFGGLGLDSIERLQGWVISCVNDRFISSSISHLISLRMAENWFIVNRANSGDWNVPHMHGGSFLSGVFYVKVPVDGDCGNLYVMEPSISELCSGGKLFSMSDLYEVSPVEGNLLTFHSSLVHFVGPNLSSSDRISYSFNMVPFDPVTGCDYSISSGVEISSAVKELLRGMREG